jgi:hypothetical protein
MQFYISLTKSQLTMNTKTIILKIGQKKNLKKDITFNFNLFM